MTDDFYHCSQHPVYPSARSGGAVWQRFEAAKKVADQNMGRHIFTENAEETKPVVQPPTDTFPKTPPKNLSLRAPNPNTPFLCRASAVPLQNSVMRIAK